MLKFKLVTPERILLDEQADSITLPTQAGEITVLEDHIPLVSNLKAGEIRYRKGNSEQVFATSAGVIEVKNNNEVIVLAETAEPAQEIDITRAEQARERAQKLMQESYRDQKSFTNAAAALEKQLVRLKVARKHRTRTHTNLGSGILNE